VLGVIQAMDDVLDDCASEHLDEATDWSIAMKRHLRSGLLVDRGGRLAIVDNCDLPALDQAR
jgi:hypothetical protein